MLPLKIVQTQDATKRQRKAAGQLATEYLGTDLREAFLTETEVFLALDGSVVVGIAAAKSLTGSHRQHYLDAISKINETFPASNRFIELLQSDTPLAVDFGVVVAPDYRGRGLSRDLSLTLIDSLRQQNYYRALLVSAWLDPRGPNRMVDFGEKYLQPLGASPEHWKLVDEQGELRSNPCPTCGFSCLCDARIYGVFLKRY